MKKISFVLTVFMFMLSCQFAHSQESEYRNFAYDLLNNNIRLSEAKNCVVSPLSMQLALTMLMNGANGNTLQQMQQATHTEGLTVEELNAYNSKLMKTLQERETGYDFEDNRVDLGTELKLANSLWTSVNFPVYDSFVAVAQDSYGAMVQSIDFGKQEDVALIDNWLSQNTEGLIPSTGVKPDPLIASALVNALYFSARWYAGEWEKKITEMPFNNSNGSVTNAKALFFDDSSNIAADGYKIGSQTLGQGIFRFSVFLPDEGNDDFVLNEDVWNTLTSQYGKSHGELTFPMFGIDNSLSQIEVLKTMGMSDAFNQYEADFSKLSAVSTYISQAQQINKFSVDENGVTGATGTVIVMQPIGVDTRPVVDITVDRPFYFTLDYKGTILYAGYVSHIEGHTAIEKLCKSESQDRAFDLQGRHMAGSIDALPAGIYLVNGKKVVKQ